MYGLDPVVVQVQSGQFGKATKEALANVAQFVVVHSQMIEVIKAFKGGAYFKLWQQLTFSGWPEIGILSHFIQ